MENTNYWQIPQPSAEDHQNLPNKVKILRERLIDIARRYPNAKLASSLAVEDMLITDLIAKLKLPIIIFTLETRKLHTETLALIPKIKEVYDIDIELYTPNQEEADQYEKDFGKFAFYESVELRKKCCYIRKIEPLNRALSDTDAWLTGQRREQSVTREQLEFEEQDTTHHIAKFNPIFDWTEHEVWAYIQENQVPFNQPYLKGYPSIGCEPCTRPVRKGEDIRAGRWWWESKDSKECGLHQN
ncbi:phosphoadenylyl-sulfate reductase [Neisseriaceae bacterium PsAf]|nr:phosphoadenylyl-sulfate reductase [Neisseriaceae bacterium PsAf]